MKPKDWIPKIKWTKGGTKLQQSEFGGWLSIEKSALATFITPSLKECLKIFGENILILKAKGAKYILIKDFKKLNSFKKDDLLRKEQL